MPDTVFPIDTSSSEKIRDIFIAYLSGKITAHKGKLPRQHIHVLPEGARQTAGVFVIVATQPDEEYSWPYSKEGRRVLEERHGIGIIVKADAKAGGKNSVLKVFSFVRRLLNTEAEREALRVLGLQNLHETTEGLEGDAGDDAESTDFRRQINLRVTTDTYLT